MTGTIADRLRESGPEDFAEKRSDLLKWTSSAFLAGETHNSDLDDKARLYSFLCVLLNYLLAAEGLAMDVMQAADALEAQDAEITRLTERCGAYKGQVKAGEAEIARLTAENETTKAVGARSYERAELNGDMLRYLRDAVAGQRMDPSVTNGQYIEMARHLHAAREGAIARAEAAEARLAEAERVLKRAALWFEARIRGMATGGTTSERLAEIDTFLASLKQEGEGNG